MAEDTPTLIFSVLEHLAALERDHPTESRDALTRAVSSLSEAFNLDIEDPSKERKFSLKPHTLATIFAEGARVLGAKSAAQTSAELQSNDAFKQFIKTVSSKGYFKGVEEGTLEYDERMSKLVAKFKERTEAVSGAPVEEAGTSIPPAVAPASSAGAVPATGAKAAKEKQAEEVKGKGNTLLMAKDYEGAEKAYSEALELSPDGPNSHVYLCNRAAALCYLGHHDDAVVDCQESIDLNPRYAKAYTRLGYAFFQLEDYEASVKAYRKSLEIEPGNPANAKSLKKALSKLGQDSSSTDMASTERGMPELSALASMMGGGANGAGAGGGAAGGGAGGLAGMLNNPNMMAQAQAVMQNPAMMSQVQSMMQNPAMMSSIMGMMGGGGGGGGSGGPDLSALAGMMGGGGSGGPDMSALASMMGGGGAGGTPDDGSEGSKKS